MDFSEKNYETILITPEFGQEILENHSNYRKISEKRVKLYADSILKNKWKISQPLIFDENGKLCDGQNRIKAVIDTGMPQWFIIICGFPVDSIDTLDNGQPRTANQVLSFQREDAHSRAAQILRATKLMPNHKGAVVLNSDLTELWDKYEDYVRFVCQLIPKKQKGFSSAPFNAAIVRALMNHPDKEETIKTLVKEAMTGQFDKSLNSGSLMKMLLSTTQYGGKGLADLYLRSCRIIKAEIDNIRISKVYTPTEDPFPLPVKFQ